MLSLRPLSTAEIQRRGPSGLLDAVHDGQIDLLGVLPPPLPLGQADAIGLIVRSGFPEIRPLSGADRMARYEAYVGSIVGRDVVPVAGIRRPDTLRRLINPLAHRTAEELNVASLCAALGARKETVTGYLDVLSRLGIVHRLGAWTSSGARKEIKIPKTSFHRHAMCLGVARRGWWRLWSWRRSNRTGTPARKLCLLRAREVIAVSRPAMGTLSLAQRATGSGHRGGSPGAGHLFCLR
jgi:hypothetical protein